MVSSFQPRSTGNTRHLYVRPPIWDLCPAGPLLSGNELRELQLELPAASVDVQEPIAAEAG
jgi:hypothetical protein